MLAWMLYVVMVTLLLSIGAYMAERAARLKRGRTRWIWITAIVASLAIPTVIASVSVQLPGVVSPRVAQKVVVLREATTQALSPVMWISGSAVEPHGWRDLDSLMIKAWRAASGAMLLALIASGVHLFLRKRRWRTITVSGASVYVTGDVGPAVVGLLRPRIVVPQWVTMAVPRHQSAVIAHEQSHLDAHDPQLFTFALALLVFMPWNLPLWWQLRRLRYAIEVDCDARVLAGGFDPARYGETLIAVGERQSAYVGAVAAMSESRSFLEERIRIMLSKPAKWRRVGMAALAGVSLALTALAAQVSPPNVRSTVSAAGESHPIDVAPSFEFLAKPAAEMKDTDSMWTHWRRHQLLQSEPRDEAWASRIEAALRTGIQDALTAHGLDTQRIELLVVECRTSGCEIQAVGFAEDNRKDVDLQVILPGLLADSLANDLDRDEFSILLTARPDDRVSFLAHMPRKKP